jgi:triacylglycerol esterase/lipase EstA (alpha/beta hydrolase family)
MRLFYFVAVFVFLLLINHQLFSSVKPTQSGSGSFSVDFPLYMFSEELLTIEDPAPQLSSEGKIPVIMVHGWNFIGKPSAPGTGFWDPHLNFLLNDPEMRKYFKPYYVKYWSNAVSINVLGGLLRDKIQLAGLHEKPFILIAHSMGGLVSRSLMNEHVFTAGNYAGTTCGDLVKLLVTLGSPHHGSPMANGPARDEKVNFFLKLYMSAIESYVFSETKYNEVNRSDLRWDNYDNLLNYTKYPAERNDWLVNLNTQTIYDPKTICYAATVTGAFKLPPYNTTEDQYQLGAYVQKESLGLDNDGIAPYKSAIFEGHTPKKIRFFNEYNHADIARGKGTETTLFTSVKEDFLEVVPPQIIWPTEAGIILKHSEIKEIRWDAPSSVQTVNIYLSGDHGQTFTKLAENIDASLGLYQWTVPDTNSTQCIIRITKASDEREFTQSLNPFVIYHNLLTFEKPVFRDYFAPNKVNTISWSQKGIAEKVKITYRDSRSGFEKVITEEFAVGQQVNNFNWETDHSIPPTDSAQIIIEMVGLEIYGDTEDYTFRSVPFMMLDIPQITVIDPSSFPSDFDGTEGEKMVVGTYYPIRWQTEGEIKFIKISLCDPAKNVINEIRRKNHAPGLHSAGSTSWKVPALFGDQFYLLFEAGLNDSTITASAYSTYPFRINKQSAITSPDDSAKDVALLPCISAGNLDGSAYYFEIVDSTTSGALYSQTFSSETPEFCFSNRIEYELSAGTSYKLTAWAMFGSIKSYPAQLFFKTGEIGPSLFQAISPVDGDTLWDDSVKFSWNRSVGAEEYFFELFDKNHVLFSEALGRADTLFSVDMDKNGYADTLFWKVTASNNFGEKSVQDYFFNKDHTDISWLADNKSSFGLVCHPNPVNDRAVFQFSLPERGEVYAVKLVVYNLTGQKISVLLNGKISSGSHQISWNPAAEKNSKGIFFTELNVDGVKEVVKMRVE